VLDISPALLISSFCKGRRVAKEEGGKRGDIRLNYLMTCLLAPELSLELSRRPSLVARCKVLYKGRYS
jgi:hypothetical protein